MADQHEEMAKRGIHIRGLPLRSSDTSIRDGLYHQYKKYGKTMVNVFGSGEERYAIISFKKDEDANKALDESQGKVFFGSEIIVSPHDGLEIADDPEDDVADKERDEYHPKATRSLFVGNLQKDVSMAQLNETFGEFGEIINIEMKTPGLTAAYAFIQYEDITCVVKALREMDGKSIGENPLKLGFGKCTPTTCVWLNNIPETITQKFLAQNFGRYGPVMHSVLDRIKQRALIYFDGIDFAQTAVNEMRGRTLNGNKIQIDFASRDFQTVFFEHMEKTDQLKPGDKPDERLLRQFQGAATRPPAGFDSPPSGDSARGRGSFSRGGRGDFRGGPPGFFGGRGSGDFFPGRGGPSGFEGGRGSGSDFFRGRGGFPNGPGRGGYDGPSGSYNGPSDYRGEGFGDFQDNGYKRSYGGEYSKSYTSDRGGYGDSYGMNKYESTYGSKGYGDSSRSYTEGKGYGDSSGFSKRYEESRDLSRYEDTYQPGLGGYSYRRQASGERPSERASPKYERRSMRRSPSPLGPPVRSSRYSSPPPPERDLYDRYESRPSESQYPKMRYRELDSPPPMERSSYRSHSRSKYVDEAPVRSSKYLDDSPRGYSDSYMKRYMTEKPRSSRAYSPVGSDLSGRRSRSPPSRSASHSKYNSGYTSKSYTSNPVSSYEAQLQDYGYRHEKRRKVYD